MGFGLAVVKPSESLAIFVVCLIFLASNLLFSDAVRFNVDVLVAWSSDFISSPAIVASLRSFNVLVLCPSMLAAASP